MYVRPAAKIRGKQYQGGVRLPPQRRLADFCRQLRGGDAKQHDVDLAETECETSNRVLEILEEWNDYLKSNVSYYQEPSP